MEARIDVDALRDYMRDEYGTAAFNGSSAAMSDVFDVDDMNGYELCEHAEEMGVDLSQFAR